MYSRKNITENYIITGNERMSTLKMISCSQYSPDHFSRKYITQNDVTVVDMETTGELDVSLAKFGTRLREMRERAGMSQEELSQAVSKMVGGKFKGRQSHISNLEKSHGDKLPSVQVLRAMAVILGTNTDYLLGLTDNWRPLGDINDEVVVTIEDDGERRMIQEMAEALADATSEDKRYIAALVMRILPKPPRIIGDDN